MPLPPNTNEVLFTQQEHHADRAGLHYDYRIVLGDKAYSWASKKQVPEPGSSIILHEQPVHDRDYALSEKVVIPKGQYGGGTTYLKWVKKGKLVRGKDHFTIETAGGEKYLLKPLPKYGEKQWLFKNLNGHEKAAEEAQREDMLFQHLIRSYLSGKPIQAKIAEKTFAVLVDKGYTSPEAILAAGYDNLVEAMKEGGYKRIDEITSRRLMELSARLRSEYGGMTNLVRSPDLSKELQTFKGIGPVTAQIFLQGLPNVAQNYQTTQTPEKHRAILNV